jgi:hypothetical protein
VTFSVETSLSEALYHVVIEVSDLIARKLFQEKLANPLAAQETFSLSELD